MNPEDIKKLIRDEIDKSSGDSRFQVSKIPYHIHNNIDSPFVPYGSISNAPPYFCVATPTSGTTPVNVFGAGGANYNLTITSVFLISKDTTAGNVSAYNGGNTIATLVKGTVSGALVGATSLSNSTYATGRTLTVRSDSLGNATLLMTFVRTP